MVFVHLVDASGIQDGVSYTDLESALTMANRYGWESDEGHEFEDSYILIEDSKIIGTGTYIEAPHDEAPHLRWVLKDGRILTYRRVLTPQGDEAYFAERI